MCHGPTFWAKSSSLVQLQRLIDQEPRPPRGGGRPCCREATPETIVLNGSSFVFPSACRPPSAWIRACGPRMVTMHPSTTTTVSARLTLPKGGRTACIHATASHHRAEYQGLPSLGPRGLLGTCRDLHRQQMVLLLAVPRTTSRQVHARSHSPPTGTSHRTPWPRSGLQSPIRYLRWSARGPSPRSPRLVHPFPRASAHTMRFGVHRPSPLSLHSAQYIFSSPS